MSRKSRRDQSLERLLRGSLASSSRPPMTGECPDAEVLAAWADGALEGQQFAAARDHVADCVSCQATLAVLARTTPIEETPAPWWSVNVRWLVPVAATATAIAIWVAVPREEYTRPAESPASLSSEPPGPQETPREAELQPSAVLVERARTAAPGATGQLPAESRLEAQKAATADAPTRQDAPAPAREAAAAEPARDAAAAAEAPAVGNLARKEAATPPANPSAAAPPPPAQPVTPQSAASQPAAPAQVGRFEIGARSAALAAPSVVVASPGTAFRWRLGSGGTVDFSTDAGRTWEARPTGVDVDLVAGASPSGTICWIVGEGGTVLLSTNGTTWRRLTPPAATDLSAVQATDARTAVVIAVDGRRFRTVDGGTTWGSL